MALFTVTHRKTMRYFIDTEFHEQPHTIELISIAVVAEDGREFYCESLDFAQHSEIANEWVKENVFPHLWHTKMGIAAEWHNHPNVIGGFFRRSVIGEQLRKFIGNDTPEFWGYYADYDWVVTCWLFGAMVDLPSGWPMYCCDIKQVCDQRGNPKLPETEGNEHHALIDARWNRSTLAWLEALPRVG